MGWDSDSSLRYGEGWEWDMKATNSFGVLCPLNFMTFWMFNFQLIHFQILGSKLSTLFHSFATQMVVLACLLEKHITSTF